MAANLASFAAVPQETSDVLQSSHESEALENCVRRYARFVFKVAYGVLRNAHDAEDVVQEVFLRVHRSGSKGVRDVEAWLATIAFRVALDRRRPESLDIADVDVPSEAASAEDVALQRQALARVQRLIAALPDDLRFPLVLSAIQELNSRHIAEVLGIPESSVRGRIMRARQVLKQKLAALSEVKP